MTLEFMRYPSLTNHYAIGQSRVFDDHMLSGSQWVATEKVDGSNISLTIELGTGEYEFGKRSGFIEDGDTPFTSVRDLVSAEDIDTIATGLRDYLGYEPLVHVFGELFGSKIQKQDYTISQSGERAVVFYDIMFEEEEYVRQLPVYVVNQIIPERLQVKEIKCDNLPSLLGKEPSDTSVYGGVNEGYVYRLMEGSVFGKDSTAPIVKHKTEAYRELRNVPKVKKVVTVEFPELLDSLRNYITVQRVMNIVSHGDYELIDKNIGPLIKEMFVDVEKEYKKENKLDVNDAEFKATLKLLSKDLALVVKQAIREGVSNDV